MADDADTRTSGFTEEERSELKALIAEAIGSATPPTPTGPTGPPPVTDDEWDKMSDRQREGWVRSLVDDTLDKLARDDADRRRDEEIESLKAKQAEGETAPADRPPSPLDKLRKFLWGDEPAKP